MKILAIAFISTASIAILSLIIFLTTPVGYEMIGKAYANANYNIYKENYTYKDGKKEHTKRLMLEMEKEKDPLVKQALQEYIETENL